MRHQGFWVPYTPDEVMDVYFLGEHVGCFTEFYYKVSEEIIKLCYWNADLKVLITYYSEKAREYKKEKLLKKLAEYIKSAEEYPEKFIILICSYPTIKWEAFVWQDGKFSLLNT